jgi:hypothetical protein
MVSVLRLREGMKRMWRGFRQKSVILLCACLCLLFVPRRSDAMNFFNPTAVGGSLVFTHERVDSVSGMGLGPGIQFMLKYREPSKSYFNLAVGFLTSTDDMFVADKFKTTIFPSLEIQYGKIFGENRQWFPSLFCGVNIYTASDKDYISVEEQRLRERSAISNKFIQSSVLLGFGMEYQPNYMYSIFMNSDYRYVFWGTENSGRQYVVMQIGFLFYQ